MYLLDTNTCIHLLNGDSPNIRQRFLAETPDTIKVCSIVKAELFFGARHSQRVQKNLSLLEKFFAPLESMPFDDSCAEQYGVIRNDLAQQGIPIGPNDLMIASIARHYDLVLVSSDVTEFGRVSGLRLENWN